VRRRSALGLKCERRDLQAREKGKVPGIHMVQEGAGTGVMQYIVHIYMHVYTYVRNSGSGLSQPSIQ
jgi:hypothetical protein